MTLDRRDFLVRTGLLVGAGALAAAGCRSDDEARRAGAAAGLDTWEGVRQSFELDRRRVQLSSFLLAAHPRPVRDAIEAHRRRLDADAAAYLQEHEERLEAEVLQGAAAYLGVAPQEVALTGSTTMGLGLLYATLELRPGEEIVTTEHDFYSTHEALRLRARATGASVRRIRLYDEPALASVDAVVEAIGSAVTRRTRAVALTWVHSSTGVKLPVRAIAAALAERDAELGKRKTLLCVDAVHGLGVEPEPLPELGCDFFVSGCHKWLFGPRGTGIVWGRPEAWSEVSPTIPSFTDRESFQAWIRGRDPTAPSAAAFTPGGYHAFEHRWALAAAFSFRQEIGRERAAERTRSLAARLKDGLLEVRGVTVRTPFDERLSAGLVCCDVPSATSTPDAFVFRLREDHGVVASLTPYATSYLRFGPSIVNSEEEVDRALEALRTLV
ncbi:MAG: aminotransferase class V-fold PLP-dependent enzyme [Gaiellaceae bacterium]